jgi:hemin uptake protein HemP
MSFAAPAFAILNFATPAETITGAPPNHDARSLTKGGSLAQISLDGQVYTLRITRAEKLILTK